MNVVSLMVLSILLLQCRFTKEEKRDAAESTPHPTVDFGSHPSGASFVSDLTLEALQNAALEFPDSYGAGLSDLNIPYACFGEFTSRFEDIYKLREDTRFNRWHEEIESAFFNLSRANDPAPYQAPWETSSKTRYGFYRSKSEKTGALGFHRSHYQIGGDEAFLVYESHIENYDNKHKSLSPEIPSGLKYSFYATINRKTWEIVADVAAVPNDYDDDFLRVSPSSTLALKGRLEVDLQAKSLNYSGYWYHPLKVEPAIHKRFSIDLASERKEGMSPFVKDLTTNLTIETQLTDSNEPSMSNHLKFSNQFNSVSTSECMVESTEVQ